MLLPSLGSAVGSEVTCGSAWNREENGIAFCTLHRYDTSIIRERPLECKHPVTYIGQLLAQP